MASRDRHNMDESIIDLANAVRSDRYKDADAVFAAGSIIRGEGTPSSDLDLVVVYAQLPSAYRESFKFDGFPIEAFVHDPETLEYFFVELDRPSGVPALPQMVVEGIEIPQASAISQGLKRRAAALIAAGPPALDRDSERRMRYCVTDLVDDLRAPRSPNEMTGAGSRLYELLADYYLRRQGLWSAKGKAIPRVLRQADATFCNTYCDAFAALFARGEPDAVIRLAEDILRESGGPLFEGFRSDAPPTWRRQPGTAV
jgi:predicted nucleotidyltransferase